MHLKRVWSPFSSSHIMNIGPNVLTRGSNSETGRPNRYQLVARYLETIATYRASSTVSMQPGEGGLHKKCKLYPAKSHWRTSKYCRLTAQPARQCSADKCVKGMGKNAAPAPIAIIPPDEGNHPPAAPY